MSNLTSNFKLKALTTRRLKNITPQETGYSKKKQKKRKRRIERKGKQTDRSAENWQRLHTIIVGIYLLQMSLCDSKRRKGSVHSWGPLHFELAPDFWLWKHLSK